jgi:hypothetical protein
MQRQVPLISGASYMLHLAKILYKVERNWPANGKSRFYLVSNVFVLDAQRSTNSVWISCAGCADIQKYSLNE